MDLDLAFQLDDAGGDFYEAQAQRVELRGAPMGTLGRGHAQAPHDPIGAGVQKEAQLVGRRFRAGGAVRAKMRLPRLDVVLGLAAAAIDVFIEPARDALSRLVTTKRVSTPSDPASVRAMMRSTRPQLSAPSRIPCSAALCRRSARLRTAPSFWLPA